MSNYIAKALFVFSVLATVWGAGALSYKYDIFPYPQLASVVRTSMATIADVEERARPIPWWYAPAPPSVKRTVTYLPERLSPGYLLSTGIKDDNKRFAQIVDNQGRIIHEWDISWDRLWPNPVQLTEAEVPKRSPGGFPHGAEFMPNGDLVFNFEFLGLIRINYCGQPVWRLPYKTHHSVYRDDGGNFWVPGVIRRRTPVAGAPNYVPDFNDYRILEVSPSGKILTDISVFDLLKKNGFMGLMYMSTINNFGTSVSGDTLHLNDIETFPSRFKEGVFKHGDVMISLRNLNAIIVFDKKTEKIKYVNIGSFIRQHDPDFLDGNRISVFDNNNLSSADSGRRPVDETGLFSKISILNAANGEVEVFYKGTKEHPFFTSILGKHQWLPNGNLLVTESRKGHAFELTSDGKLVWEYYNTSKNDHTRLGLLSEMQRLPPKFDEKFFAGLGRRCGYPLF